MTPRSVLGLVLLGRAIRGFDKGTEGVPVKFADDGKCRRLTGTSEDRIGIQNDLNRASGTLANTKERDFKQGKRSSTAVRQETSDVQICDR